MHTCCRRTSVSSPSCMAGSLPSGWTCTVTYIRETRSVAKLPVNVALSNTRNLVLLYNGFLLVAAFCKKQSRSYAYPPCNEATKQHCTRFVADLDIPISFVLLFVHVHVDALIFHTNLLKVPACVPFLMQCIRNVRCVPAYAQHTAKRDILCGRYLYEAWCAVNERGGGIAAHHSTMLPRVLGLV